MVYFYLVVCSISLTLNSLMSKFYDTKNHKTNPFIFNSIVGLFAFFVFLIKVLVRGGGFNFSATLLLFSAFFCIFFSLTLIFQILALKNGPLSFTSLFLSFSLLLPILYGIIFKKETLKLVGYIGIATLILSIVLINVKKDNGTKFSFKWLLFAIIAFLGNGCCSILNITVYDYLDVQATDEYMMFALFFAFIVLFIVGYIYSVKAKSEGKLWGDIKRCSYFAPAGGVAIGLCNLFALIVINNSNVVWFFPLYSASTIVLSFVLAITIFKEKLSPLQYIGYAFGIASVVLLNL